MNIAFVSKFSIRERYWRRENDLLEKISGKIDELNRVRTERNILKDEAALLKSQLAAADQTIQELERTSQNDAAQNKIAEECDQMKRELARLKAQANRNSANSSLPFSPDPSHKTIHSSRIPSGRKPGAQPCHPGHCRHDLPVDRTIVLNIPQKVSQNPEQFSLLPDQKSRKSAAAVLAVNVIEYVQLSWKNKETGEIVKSDFPASCTNEINYVPSIKALLCLITNECHISIRKAQKLVQAFFNGRLNISTGTISNLAHEYSMNSRQECQEIINILREQRWMNIDTTYLRTSGYTAYTMSVPILLRFRTCSKS